jgi:hypothetical protein
MDYFSTLLSNYRSKGALVDANLLLVYFVGSFDPAQIARYKRTKAYTEEDFQILAAVVDFFGGRLVTTPNVMTEVNSLSNQLPEALKPSYYAEFSRRVVAIEEHYVESKQATRSSHFLKFGLTDSGIIELVKDKYLVITDDLRFASYCQNISIDVINFNNLRALYW